MYRQNNIKILVVEDIESKRTEINDRLCNIEWDGIGLKPAIAFANNAADAVERYSHEFFEIVILDLYIPAFAGGDCDIEHAKGFYDYMKKARRETPFFVLGLTSFEERGVAAKFPIGANFTIERYDAGGQWVEKITDRLRFLVGAKAGLAKHLSDNYWYDVIIVTARKTSEYDPVMEMIAWEGRPRNAPELNGIRSSFGFCSWGKTSLRIGVVCLDEMGLSHSAAVTVDLVHLFRPRYLVMLGMCCGLRKNVTGKESKNEFQSKLGDVIIASGTSCWDEGKYDDNDLDFKNSILFNNRAVIKTPEREFWKKVERILDEKQNSITKKVREFYGKADIVNIRKGLMGNLKFSPKANISWHQMISGPCVVNSAELINEIEARFSQALGLEMEAHGIYSAIDCVSGRKPEVLVIKGVADFGDGTKAKSLQATASAASFLVFEGILEQLIEKN